MRVDAPIEALSRWGNTVSKLYGESQRRLQRQFDTERLANRIEERLFREHLTSEDRAFIERMDIPVHRERHGATGIPELPALHA